MNIEILIRAAEVLERSVTLENQTLAAELRRFETAQREALARMEAERDALRDQVVKSDAVAMANHFACDTAQAQLAELKSAYITMTNQSILVDGEHCYYLKSSEMAAFDRIFTNAQAEQQEAQGAQAGDDKPGERRCFERWYADRFGYGPDDGDWAAKDSLGQYLIGSIEESWRVWQARAALATQPAKRECNCPKIGERFSAEEHGGPCPVHDAVRGAEHE